MWIAILGLGLMSVRVKKHPVIQAAMLSIVGLTVFELIFEARARYLFAYVPIYILLGMIGLGELYNLYVYLRAHKQKTITDVNQTDEVTLR